MRSVTIAVLLASLALGSALKQLDLTEDLIAAPSSPEAESVPAPPPVKLDKTLRRALLKALVDLEAESAEQQQQQQQKQPGSSSTERSYKEEVEERSTDRVIDDSKYDFLEISRQKSATFSFDGFPSEEDIPSEDKLQNSSFVETDKYALSDNPESERETEPKQPPKDYTKGVQVHHIIPSEKASGIYEIKPAETLETVESRNIATTATSSAPSSSKSADVSIIQKSVTLAPVTETLSVSASGNIASAVANSLVAPRPTVSTKTSEGNSTSIKVQANSGSKIVQGIGKKNKEEAEDVKIFQAPLVAAFTVQQDERGVPKSVVPLFKTGSNAQAQQPLSLQEQLEFKQRLLEKQLAQLQAQQAQQTDFLLRQRQAFEEQIRQKQQQEYFLQEQRRLKLFQEQEQQRLIQQQRLQQQFSLQRLVPQQSFQQQQLTLVQQQQPPFQQPANFKVTNVQLQPSLSLEVPNVVPPPPFQGQQTLQQQPFQFQPFPVDFQQPPSPAPLARFHRQEDFGSVGNFGFNNFQHDDKGRSNQFNNQQRPFQLQQSNSFTFDPFRQQQQQQRSFAPVVTPARQIQDLLYQSGITGDLQSAGTRNQEDLNIVSKVLALNVGAGPNSAQQTKAFHQQQQFGALKK